MKKLMFLPNSNFINKHLWSLGCSWTYWANRTGSAGYLPFQWVGFCTTSCLCGQRRTSKSCRTFDTSRRSSGTDFIRITVYAGRGSTGSRVWIGCTSSTCCPPIHSSKTTVKQQIHTLKLNRAILLKIAYKTNWFCFDHVWRSVVLTLSEGQQS